LNVSYFLTISKNCLKINTTLWHKKKKISKNSHHQSHGGSLETMFPEGAELLPYNESFEKGTGYFLQSAVDPPASLAGTGVRL
jgi:hypothetical protein